MMPSLASNALYLLFISCIPFPHLTNAQDNLSLYTYCNNAVNYSSGSIYEENRNLALTSLATNASLTGFFITSVGQNLDVVYGLVQCRGDISKEDCQVCVNNSTVEIIQRCPNQKEASIGYPNCWLRYADWRFFSSVSSSPMARLQNTQNADDPVLFNRQLGYLIRNLTSNTASSPSRFSVGSTHYTDFILIYAMMQCTRDLAENSCLSCLQDISRYSPACCNGSVGGQVASMSCNLRFETYSFFSLSPPPPPASSPPVPESNSNTTRNGTKNTLRTIITVAIPVAVALVLLSGIFGAFLWGKTNRERVDDVHEDGDKMMESLSFRLSTLKIATRNFSNEYKLGQGGFGPVYKGKLFDGREIAVKRLSSSSGQGLEELKTEVILVAKLLHRNLVRLVGFCLEEQEKLLVYEYLPNGSLDNILFDPSKRSCLEWERRYKLIVGIARGLLYLHEDSQLKIIHRDLKASNILLDEHMNPKISDFGLARLFNGRQTQGNTNRIAGTHGYMAPEYAKKGHFSTKSDVYSFGVLVLEVVTGQKNSRFRNSMNLQSYAWKHWANGTALELLDPLLGDQWPRYEILKCIHIGLLCVQEAAVARPTMSEIGLMLSTNTLTTATPSPPAYFVSSGEDFKSDVITEGLGASQLDQSKRLSFQQSINDVTISEIDPR